MKLKADLQYKEVKTTNFFFRKFTFGKNILNSFRENKIKLEDTRSQRVSSKRTKLPSSQFGKSWG